MWRTTELSMAWLSRSGICTWSTSPTNDSTSDVTKIPWWARSTGMARRNHVLVVSGSTVALGASYRATSSPAGGGDAPGVDGGVGAGADVADGLMSGPPGRGDRSAWRCARGPGFPEPVP